MSVGSDISAFKDFFEKRISLVDSIQCDEEHTKTAETTFKKIAYSAILDALAGHLYKKEDKHREKLETFIRTMSGWKDYNRICITHLKKALAENPEPHFQEVWQKANELFTGRTFNGNDADISNDPTYDEIANLWPKNNGKFIPIINGKFTFEWLTHFQLFYSNRNSLVHECLDKSSYDIGSNPRYMKEEDRGKRKIILVYPESFYKKICTDSLANLVSDFEQNDLSPISNKIYTHYWRPELTF